MENARAVLDAWLKGKWPGEKVPECVRYSWLSVSRKDKESVAALKTGMSEAQRALVDEFDAGRETGRTMRRLGENPSAEELAAMNGGEIAELVDERGMAAKPLSVELLAKLPREKRGEVWESYFQWLYPFNSERAAEEIEKLDQAGLDDEEKGVLFAEAANHEWFSMGDAARAFELASRIPDEKARGEALEELATDYAHTDPQGALEFAATLPEGDLREKMVKTANDSMP